MTDAFSIRPATPADASAIALNNQRMALETENKALPGELIVPGVTAVLNDASKGFYIVAEANGKVAGNLMITYEWSDWRNGNIWWIQSVYVIPECRGKGVFRALFDFIRAAAQRSGAKEIRLYAEQENANAHQVYEKLGMQRSHYLMFEMKV